MFYYLGIAICLAAILQMVSWISLSVLQHRHVQGQFDANRKLVEQQIADAINQRKKEAVALESGEWKGYREFTVDKLVKEVDSVTSVFLKPVDGKAIATFRPGQHLSIKFQVPGESKPVVRCYSLSCGPNSESYRISVKAVPPPVNDPEVAPGRVSNFINNQLMVGDRLQVKAPSGSFCLDENGDAPIVLLGGGIGITPMASMVEHLIRVNSERLIVLFYGVRNSKEHTFKDYFEHVSKRYANVHVVNCYSNPLPEDLLNRDYHVNGFVSIELIQKLLPSNQCKFYLCGPPPFMESLHNGLQNWGVPEGRIAFEAFGPASIKKTKSQESSVDHKHEKSVSINFRESGKEIAWSAEHESLLEFAEANGIEIESGCRAGSCGTCMTKLVYGDVCYPDGIQAECEAGHCLPCIATPQSNVDLEV